MNFGQMIQVAMRLVTHYRDIERVWPQIVSVSGDIQRLMPQVQSTFTQTRDLVGKIAPELLTAVPLQRSGPDEVYDVRWLQRSLNTLIDAKLEVDGNIGPITTGAIRTFQKMHGLVPDGWAGIETEALILSLLEQQRGPP